MLTVRGVARLLGLPESWVYERTRHEQIPGFKVGKYWRFCEDEVLAWFEQFRKGPTLTKGASPSPHPRADGTSTVSSLDADGSVAPAASADSSGVHGPHKQPRPAGRPGVHD